MALNIFTTTQSPYWYNTLQGVGTGTTVYLELNDKQIRTTVHPITTSQGVQLCFQKLNHGCPHLESYDFVNSLKFYRTCHFRQSIPISSTTIWGRLVVVASRRDSQDNIQKACRPKSPQSLKRKCNTSGDHRANTKGPANNSHAHCMHSSPPSPLLSYQTTMTSEIITFRQWLPC